MERDAPRGYPFCRTPPFLGQAHVWAMSAGGFTSTEGVKTQNFLNFLTFLSTGACITLRLKFNLGDGVLHDDFMWGATLRSEGGRP